MLRAAMTVLVLVAALVAPAIAADDCSHIIRSDWIKQLVSEIGKTNCCAEADGEDVFWEPSASADSGYKIFTDGGWHPVPRSALITVPNCIGKALVWLNFTLDNGRVVQKRPSQNDDGPVRTIVAIEVRCFLPGAAYLRRRRRGSAARCGNVRPRTRSVVHRPRPRRALAGGPRSRPDRRASTALSR